MKYLVPASIILLDAIMIKDQGIFGFNALVILVIALLIHGLNLYYEGKN